MEQFPHFTKAEWNLMVRTADMLLNHVNEYQKCSDVAMQLYGLMADLIGNSK